MDVPHPALFAVLVDLSADPCEEVGGRAVALERARLFADSLLEGLAACAANQQLPWEFDVAAVGYRRRGNVPEVVSLLPTTPRGTIPLVALLTAEIPEREADKPRRWLAEVPSEGEAAPDSGWNEVSRLFTQWLASQPNPRPPVLVHCVFEPELPDSESAAERGVRALGQPAAPVAVFTYRLTGDESALTEDLPIATVWELLFADETPVLERTDTRPETPPFEVVREFHCQKLGNDLAQWEDGFAMDAAMGRAAIADGASEGIYCRAWADLLSAGFVATPPSPAQHAHWVEGKRGEWRQRIDFPNLNWSKKAKAESTGAAATLLGLSIEPIAPEAKRMWRALAVGDACLFWIRDGRLRASFPLACHEQLGSAPNLLRTLTSHREPSPLIAGGTCEPGDLFLLATDAVSGALFRDHEANRRLDRYAELSEEQWHSEVAELRRSGGLVNDDCTLIVLRVL